ncbi:MAG TPA: hypothetical protein VIK74_05295 [Parasegetibacter sp.]
MNNFTTITGILSRINFAFGALLCLISVTGLLLMANAALLIPVLLTGAVVLHSYAALQLRRSVVDPFVPLDSKTPTGIRFIGYLALLFAVVNISNGIVILKDTDAVLAQVEMPAEASQFDMHAFLRGAAVIILIFSASIVVNVLLNLLLLRKFMLENRS